MKHSQLIVSLLNILFCFASGGASLSSLYERSNSSGMIKGITEMVTLLAPKSLVILVQNETKIDRLDKLTVMIHHLNIPTCVYYDLEGYFDLIEENLKQSLETTSLILCHPEDMLQDIIERRLAHRLSLFIFYWGATQLPEQLKHSALLKEPFRLAVITNPRRNIYRVFYNQAKPNNHGEMLSVNWFDGNDMTFKRVPLLPSPTEVYKNFEGRVFSIPVIHKPPWHFVLYENASENVGDATNSSNGDVGFEMALERNVTIEMDDAYFTVKGGRDHNLMQLIAERMNFSFQYVEPPEKIQGIAMGAEGNASFSGALGMLQRRDVDLYLGDVAVTWERMKAVEFSFFTLADSAAFVTHAPRKLNEALALVRPFQLTVWPPVIITILISGPILYLIISTPLHWKRPRNGQSDRFDFRGRKRDGKCKPTFYNIRYIEEMSYTRFTTRRHRMDTEKQKYPSLDRCIWYTINVYLRQSANIPFDGHLARFFSILLWLCATYVLGDVYSAQLTSQLARPARESPINTLGRLELRMTADGYQLLVESQSAFHAALVNSTGILQRLYRLTRQRSVNDSFLVRSVEEGIRVLLDDPKFAVFGGRETLYFNTKRYGANRFQLSEKLYTRYSAVAVQIGCPFLDSLNEVIMRLFEAGIIEKITIAEYESMFGRHNAAVSHSEETVRSAKSTNAECDTELAGGKRKSESNEKLQPMNLRMLQGAFLVLACGHLLGGICLFFERHMGMVGCVGFTVTQLLDRGKHLHKNIMVILRGRRISDHHLM